MKQFIIFAFCTMMFLNICYSITYNQKQLPNNLGISFGMQISSSQDLLYSPMIYDGLSLSAFTFQYSRETDLVKHLLHFSTDKVQVSALPKRTFPFFDRVKSSGTTFASFYNLRYGYTRILTQNDKARFFIGGMLDTYAHLIEYNFVESNDESYLLSYAAGLLFLSEFSITKSSFITAEASIPLLALESRPTYSTIDNREIQSNDSGFIHASKRAKLRFIGDFYKLKLFTSYNLLLPGDFQLILSYRLEVLNSRNPQQISILRHGLQAGLAINF